MNDLIHARISQSALRHNARLLIARTRPALLCAILKANAYGHGVAGVSRVLSGLGPAFWGVTSGPEAMELKALKVRGAILIFRPVGAYEPEKTLREHLDWIVQAAVRVTVVNSAGLKLMARAVARRRRPAYLHIKTDTGMGRNGCPSGMVRELICQARRTPGLIVEGLYSHFAAADQAPLNFARRQLRVFHTLVRDLESGGLRIPIRHMANSGAIFNLPDSHLDLVRPGLALYGYGGGIPGAAGLQPVLRVEAPVLMTKWLPKGHACGYDRTFIARRRTRIGLLPIGYADGYSRGWSNIGQVDFRGHLAPVIGRISMDLTIADFTDLPEVQTGHIIGIISNRREDPHSVESMARRLKTIPNEITCRLGPRIQRQLAP